MRKIPIIAAFLLGINAILIQVILIRELLVGFSGNELSMGIIFSAWLIGGAIGSLIVARILINKITSSINIFATALSLISIAAPLMVFLSRAIRVLLDIPVYEMVGPLYILFICALLLVPLSLLLSLCFLLCCKALKDTGSNQNSPAIIYVFEAIGATSAGAIFTFLLIRYFGSFQIVIGLAFANFLFLLLGSLILKKRPYLPLLLLILSLVSILLNAPQWLDKRSQALQWYPQKVLAYKSSPYGNISVTKTDETFNFYENGALLFTTQDEAFNEEYVHLLMLQHAAPKRVLLIGGGIGGILNQILKHNPERVTYLELDPLTIDIGKEFISEEDKAALTDARVEIRYEDGRFFIKRTDEKFDIIIVNLPDPTTLGLNRFYTKEFYREALSSLEKGGILTTRASSKESIISDELARYNASIYKTLRSVFSYVSLIPGESLIFIASESLDTSKKKPDILIERFNNRGIDTRFLTAYQIKDRYYPFMLDYLKKRLSQQYNGAKLNSDFYPICFYYDLILWGVKFHPRLAGFFRSIADINLPKAVGVIALLFIIAAITTRSRKDPVGFAVLSAVAVSGGAGIALEVIIILSFQISYGYVYSKVGLLIALFMMGLALGGYIMHKALRYFKSHMRLFISIMLIFSVYILSVPLIIKIATSIPSEVAQFIFYLMILAAGLGVGGQFPIGVAILAEKRGSVHSASVVWGSDLLGATAGTLFSSLLIIPLIGIFQTAFLGSSLCAMGLILLLLSRQRPRR